MYFPKSKILENQYTSGKEFVLKTNQTPYRGYYYILSSNRYFTGKTYTDISTQELIKIEKTTDSVLVFNVSSGSVFTLPKPYYASPTNEEYKVGYMTRYFIKRRNANYNTIIEISKNDYDAFNTSGQDLNTSLYVTVKLNWKITGPLHDDFRDPHFPKVS